MSVRKEHYDSLTKEVVEVSKELGTDFQCLSHDEKLVLSSVYFWGTHGKSCIKISNIIEIMENTWPPIIYNNRETHERYIRRIVNQLRYKGYPILSFYGDNPGYTWPRDKETLIKYKEGMIKSIRKRFAIVNHTIKGANKLLNTEIQQLKLYKEEE